MTEGSKLSFPEGCGVETKDARFLGGISVASAGSARGAGGGFTIEALFVPGDRKNSDLRVSVHFLFLFLSAFFVFSVSSFDIGRKESKLF